MEPVTQRWLNDCLRLDMLWWKKIFRKKEYCVSLKDGVQPAKCYTVNKKFKVSCTMSPHPEMVVTLWIEDGWKVVPTK